MTDRGEQARLREHFAELRRAARGIRHDVSLEMDDLGRKIERLPTLTGKELKSALYDIEADFGRLGRAVGHDMKQIPGEIASAIAAGATAVRDTAHAAAGAALAVGHAAKEGTRNTLAAAAGINRKPIKGWSPPGADRESPPSESSSEDS